MASLGMCNEGVSTVWLTLESRKHGVQTMKREDVTPGVPAHLQPASVPSEVLRIIVSIGGVEVDRRRC